MLVSTKNLSLGWNNLDLIQDLNISLKPGQTTAIMGGSGSGKSTLLRVLASINLATDINVSGYCTSSYRRPSFIFQQPVLIPYKTIRENISLASMSLNLKSSGEEIELLINSVGLQDAADKLPNELSGGMKSRTSLARAFANNPDILFLDEPFGSLDIGWRHQLYKSLHKLQQDTKVGIIIVTHDLDEAIELADEIIVLNSKNGGYTKIVNTNVHIGTKERIKSLLFNDHE